jgi:hypothetical protein
MKNFFYNSKKHLNESQKNYNEHLRGAFYYGYKMFIGSIASFIHGLFPCFLDGISAKIIIDIYHNELKNHKNEKYQKWIKEKLNDY